MTGMLLNALDVRCLLLKREERKASWDQNRSRLLCKLRTGSKKPEPVADAMFVDALLSDAAPLPGDP